MSEPSYSKNFEALIAMVTYSAMDKFVQHQPQWFANQLSLDRRQAQSVLKQFSGLFRESKGKATGDDRYYSLHLRYARQHVTDEEGNRTERPPLELEDLMALIELITERTHEEKKRSLTITTTMVAAFLSLAASVGSLIVALTRG